MPGDTPKECPSCKSDNPSIRMCVDVENQDADGHVPYCFDCLPCEHEWHGTTGPAPDPFDAALAALDVEPTHHTDRMVTTYDILGLDAVRAAHRAEVDAAVARASTPTASNYLNVDALRQRVEFLEKHAAQRDAAHRAEVERAVAEEREACAKVCDDLATDVAFRDSSRSNDATCALSECATAIRALPLPAPAVDEARKTVVANAKAWVARPVAGRGAYKATAALEESIEALLAAESDAALRRAKGGTGG